MNNLSIPVPFHLKLAIVDLIGAYEACIIDDEPRNHNWDGHKQTILDLLANYPFLEELDNDEID
jgi:hypothetical protein